MQVEVSCTHDEAGEVVPALLRLGRREVYVSDVLDRWPGADHCYFKLRDTQGRRYILRRELADGTWDLILYEARPNSAR